MFSVDGEIKLDNYLAVADGFSFICDCIGSGNDEGEGSEDLLDFRSSFAKTKRSKRLLVGKIESLQSSELLPVSTITPLFPFFNLTKERRSFLKENGSLVPLALSSIREFMKKSFPKPIYDALVTSGKQGVESSISDLVDGVACDEELFCSLDTLVSRVQQSRSDAAVVLNRQRYKVKKSMMSIDMFLRDSSLTVSFGNQTKVVSVPTRVSMSKRQQAKASRKELIKIRSLEDIDRKGNITEFEGSEYLDAFDSAADGHVSILRDNLNFEEGSFDNDLDDVDEECSDSSEEPVKDSSEADKKRKLGLIRRWCLRLWRYVAYVIGLISVVIRWLATQLNIFLDFVF